MSRKRKLKAVLVTFVVGLSFSVVWDGLGGGETEEWELTGVTNNRKLLGVSVYPVAPAGFWNCTGITTCPTLSQCHASCNGKTDCAGFWMQPTSEGLLCTNLTLSNTLSLGTIHRRPGAPCVVNDTVYLDPTGSNRQEGEMRYYSGDKIVLYNKAKTAVETYNRADVYRYNVNTSSYESCYIKSEGTGLYPPNAFSKSQRRQGAIVLYAMGVLYMFFALAIVCDDYFVPALEALTVKMSLSDDVAGATFMAAGGSAPELFTSFIGVFIAKSDVGFGTIIGSAVFNVLFVIGACSIATRELAKEEGGLPLTWWPLARDSTFYLVDLVLLMVFFIDKKIEIWESGLLLLCYAAYVVFMAYNLPVYTKVRAILDKRSGKVVPDKDEEKPSYPTTEEGALKPRASQKEEDKDKCGSGWAQAKTRARSNSTSHILTRQQRNSKAKIEAQDEKPADDDNDKRDPEERKDADDDDDDDDEPWSPSPPSEGIVKWLLLFPLNFPLYLILPSGQKLGAEKDMFEREHQIKALSQRLIDLGGLKKKGDGKPILPSVSWLKEHSPQLVKDDDDELRGEDDERSPSEVLVDLIKSFDTETTSGHAEAAAFLGWSTGSEAAPIEYGKALKAKYGSSFGKTYVGGFVGSICWIGWFTYLMVWWAETIGNDLGISEVVMGVTFIAAGTSVPDLISSVIVARDGKGDMAVSSSIGSNIFDATFGLPMPWFFWSLSQGGEAISVEAKALGTLVLMLVGMLICVIAAIAGLGWRLNAMLGGLSLILYGIFVTVTILMNVGSIPTAF